MHTINKNGVELLKSKRIQATTVRLQLLNVLANAKQPLTTKEIEDEMGPNVDRVTLYRTYKLFVEKGLMHRIEISDALVAYRLTSATGNGEHLHFYCIDCRKIFCMPQYPATPMNLPQGFESVRYKMVVDGICKTCNIKAV